MDFHTYRPGPPLDRFIESMWYQDVSDWPFGRETLLPAAGATLILNLGGPQDLVDEESGSVRVFRDAWVAGERSRPIVLDSHGKAHLLGLQFRPGGAYPFLKRPMADLRDQVVELDAVWGPVVEELRQRIHEAETPQARFAVVRADLEARLQRRRWSSSPLVLAGARRITRDSARVSIDDVVRRLGISHKHFIRLFEAQVGLGPKVLHRVVRFQNAVQLADEPAELPWGQIAHRCGFSDQAHLTREFRTFAGLTPSEYRARTHFPNYVPEEPSSGS